MRTARIGPIIVHWTARLLSVLPLAFVIIAIAHEGSNPIAIIRSTHGLFLFFPIGGLAGFLLAWRWELIGGMVSVGSLAMFYVLHYVQQGRVPAGANFLIFCSPAFLFLVAWMWRRLGRQPLAL